MATPLLDPPAPARTAPAPAAGAAAPAFEPYVPADTALPELTVPAVLIGVLLGLVFAASSVYLALKIGLTVSASIPIAVLSITIFNWVARRTGGRPSILRNNIVQTTGSAGESIAAGTVFTLPALLLLGYSLPWTQVAAIALVGGLLGVLLMIPLRRSLIVEEHANLVYPEGTACAEVLIAGEKGGTQAKTVFGGFFLGAVLQVPQLGRAPVGRGAAQDVRARRCRAAARAVRRDPDRGEPRARRRGLHHRAEDRRLPVRRRRGVVLRAHPGHQVLRRRARDAGGAGPPSSSPT
jgi:hypothetical protein